MVSFDLERVTFPGLSQSPACETALWLTNVATTFQRQSRPTEAAITIETVTGYILQLRFPVIFVETPPLARKLVYHLKQTK